MSYQSIQKAIKRPQESAAEPFSEEVYSHDDNVDVYSLEEMVNLSSENERIELRFFSPTPSGIKYRLQDSKKYSCNLDEVLGDGGRKAWLLYGYEVSADGLILTFLPHYRQSLMEAARQCLATRQTEADDDAFDEDGVPHYNAEGYRADILRRFARTVYVTGTFQAWHNKGEHDGEIIACNDERISVLIIDGGFKDQKVVFYRKGKKPPRVVIYY